MIKTQVKILLRGYLENESGGLTRPTITLVRSENYNIIVDPGTVKNQKEIVDALKKEELSIDDINIVFITHSHLDHYRNIGMFPKAKTLEYFGLWGNDGSIVDYNKKFSKDIEIIKTPGHNYDGLTLLVTVEPSSTPGVKESEHPRGVSGQVAICGDVFWKENYPKKDPYASDPIALEVSRKKVLKLANYVIPGHGEIFSTKKCD